MQSTKLANKTIQPLPTAQHWHYRIEGAQKIVFSHTGPSPRYASKILWLHAIPHNNHLLPPSPEQPLQSLFVKNLKPYIYPPTPHPTNHSFLTQLALHAEPLRPPARRLEKSIPTHNTTVYTERDACSVFGDNTIVVEVKPKDASLSTSRLVPPSVTRSLQKFTIPTYHVKNYLMHAVSPPPHLAYHPSQFLSGSFEQVLHSLSILLRDRARGFRVFQNRRAVIASPCIKQTSATPCSTTFRAAATAIQTDAVCVNAIADIQKFDYLDNIGAALLFQHLTQRLGERQARLRIDHYLHVTDLSAKHMEDLKAARKLVSYDSPQQAAVMHSDLAYERAVARVADLDDEIVAHMLADFMQSAVAKDCSILISLCMVEKAVLDAERESDWRMVSVDGQRWFYDIQVVDIEAKSVDKIVDKWAPTDWQRADKLNELRACGELI